MDGYIHSIESMGLVDGPGIRTVVFLSGCRLRCRYCHNPDTWKEKEGTPTSPEALLKKLTRFSTYYRASGGGVTFSGGEPLMQPDFLLEMLTLCKKNGIHTCIDSAGFFECGEEKLLSVLEKTDLILYDIKHENPDAYRAITGQDIGKTERFLTLAQQIKVPFIIRHVVVPSLTDGEEHLAALRRYIDGIEGVLRVELLPYHRLGVHKYDLLGIPYTLCSTPVMDPERCGALQEKYFGDIGKNAETRS